MLLPECYVRRAALNVTKLLRKPAQMSFLGVGAPEALLVGVVALVVFGPKGLAEAAKSVGQTLRSFQPTIKEVVQVSQELKGTLEQELGLNELRQAARPTSRIPETLEPLTSEAARELDPDIDLKRAEAAKLAWGGSAAPEAPLAPLISSEVVSKAPPAPTPEQPKDLSSRSLEELEAELARRRGAGVSKPQV